MFSGLKVFTIASLAAFAVAQTSQCNTGDMQCCQSTQTTKPNPTSLVGGLVSLLGLNLQAADLPLGVTCSPISVIGGGSSSCTAQPVCCSNNNFNGVVALGCTPINVNL